MTVWSQDHQATARKGGDAPPLLRGQAGHPCASCHKISLYEWSPGRNRACSAQCLLAQTRGENQTIEAAVKARHGASLEVLARGAHGAQ